VDEKDFISGVERCVKCGGCRFGCPTFEVSSDESHTARGRLRLIKALIDGDIKPGRGLNDKIYGCILCGRCSMDCPLGVDVEEIIYHARKILKGYDSTRGFFRFLTSAVFRNTDRSVRLLRPFRRIVLNGFEKRHLLPGGLEIGVSPFKRNRVFRPRQKVGRVAVFLGCTVKHVYPEIGFALANVLKRINYEVVFLQTEVCCGAPFRALGMEDEAARYALKNYELFHKLNVDAVVSPCPTCVVALKKHYPALIGKGFENIYEASEFLADRLPPGIFSEAAGGIKKRAALKAVFHDPCHAINSLRIKEQPRKILAAAGTEVVEPKTRNCCGFGGTFSFFFKEESQKILEGTAAALSAAGAEAVATSCPNCILQLTKTLDDRPVYHFVELVDEALTPEKKG
jgi:glycolate oxidase iron-sulfur subunit